MAVFVSNADLSDAEIKKNEDRALRQSIIDEQGEPVFYKMHEGNPTSIAQVKAPFFVTLYSKQNDLVWEEEQKRFYEYQQSTGLWRKVEEPSIVSSVHRFMLKESRSDELAKGMPTMNLEALLTLKFEEEIIKRLKGNVAVKGEFDRKEGFATGERYIHFMNGVKVIEDGKLVDGLHPFDKRFFSTGRIPLNYDPDADCPRFRAWLQECLDPAEADADTDAILIYIGMCLVGFNMFQKILLLHGQSGSGKSSMSLMVQMLIGDGNCAEFNTSTVDKNPFAMSAFVNVWLLYTADVASNFLLKPGAAMLKKLTGGDKMQAQFKFGGFATITGTLNTILTMNTRSPTVRLDDDVDAWRRRFIVIPFLNTPSNDSEEFSRFLIKEEGSGIVNQALQALFAARESGRRFPMSKAQLMRVDEMLGRSDTVGEFLLDRVEIEKGEELIKSSLVREYMDYCKVRHWAVGGHNEIGGKLKALMQEKFGVAESNSIEDHRGKCVQGYRGVRLKD
jgi:P4 family phage/plasmid primase-like protien